MKMTLSKRQIEMLSIVDELGGADGWGEIFSHYDTTPHKAIPLEMKNFDRVSDSLVKRGLLSVDKDSNSIEITEAGRFALAVASGSFS